MIKCLKAIYQRQMFFPSGLGIFINPFYFARSGLRDAMKEFAPVLSGRVLDVGCGRKPYREMFLTNEYIGLEINTPKNRANKQADFFYDGNSFPFADIQFDGVVCNQVLEHVFTPDQFLSETHRVLRSEGLLLLTVPFVWDEHEQPWDYARYSSFGLKSLLEKNGFEVLQQRKINADVRVLFQLVNAYLYKALWTKWSMVNLLICGIAMAPFNILGMLLYRVLPANPDLYLDQVVLARKVEND